MKYNRHTNYRKRRRTVRRVWLAVFVLLLLLTAGGLYLAYENFKAVNFNSEEQTTSSVTTSYVAPSIQVFRSPYFQFQANKSWSEDTDNSKDGVFIYRSLRGGLLEHQLIVYVNNAPASLTASHAMPVAVKPGGGLSATDISEHCGKASNYKTSAGITTVEGIKMKCLSDQTRYTALAGIVGGSTAMSLPRPDGSTASYTVFYSNVMAQPEAMQFKEILNTFQTR